MLLLFAFSGRAQETFVVSGYLNSPSTNVSANFQKNMFCYLNGDFIMPEFSRFCTFRVDSVISGLFKNFNDEINKLPFFIQVALVNECVILDYPQNYTLKIKQFPYANYYYIDSLNQVSPNEKYLDKLAEYYENHQENVEILTKGTLQERRDLLDKMHQNNYIFQYKDYRYIPYILPFMTSKDSIANYFLFSWDGIDKETGKRVGGTIPAEDKGLYSYFLYRHLNMLSPFTLPNMTTDSIGWHQWHNTIFLSKNCFQHIEYTPSRHKMIANNEINSLHFIPDMVNRKLYFRTETKPFVLSMDTEKLDEGKYSQNCNYPPLNNDYSIKNYEIPQCEFGNIRLYTLTGNVFCGQEKIIPVKYEFKSYIYSIVIHYGDDFLMLWSDNPDGYNSLKAGKIDRKGEWIIEPVNLYTKLVKRSVGDIGDIGTFSFYQSNKNETTFAFSDRTYGKKSYSASEKYTDAIIVYKISANLEIKDSAVLAIDFPRSDYHFEKTHLLKKDKTYLLLAEVRHNNGYQLYYRLLNDDLTPKTDFIKLSNYRSWHSAAKPILTSEGFMISWVDNDLSEHVVRSVLIDKSGKQSKIINITNQTINNIYNVEFDKNNVDIYLYNQDEKMLIRKRIEKKEYGF